MTTPPAPPPSPGLDFALDRRRSYLGHYAGFVSRLAAFAIDVVILSATIVFTGWFLNTSLTLLQVRPFLTRLLRDLPTVLQVVNFLFSSLFASLASLVFIVVYYVFFWAAAGQTPGKYLMGVKVVALDGPKVQIRRALLRYLGYYLSALPLGLGFLWILVDDQRRGWHDRLSRTCVIYTWDARPDETFLVRASQQIQARREALKALISRQK